MNYLIEGGIIILRVIAGDARGLQLKTPKGTDTRPTTDRVKESLFNIIRDYIPKANVLDLFSGTGSLGIESLSRGAEFSVFVDRSKECISLISDNLTHTKFTDKSLVLNSDANYAISKLAQKKLKFDLIFLDPPYSQNFIGKIVPLLIEYDIMNNECLIVIEHSKKDVFSTSFGPVKLLRTKEYGDTVLSFMENSDNEEI